MDAFVSTLREDGLHVLIRRVHEVPVLPDGSLPGTQRAVGSRVCPIPRPLLPRIPPLP